MWRNVNIRQNSCRHTTWALAGILACSSATDTPPSATIGVLAGDGQTTIARTAVAIAPTVVVSTAGTAIAGRLVTFTVKSGGGLVNGGSVATDVNGVAHAGQWILGPSLGEQRLDARISDSVLVTFKATAVLGAVDTAIIVAGDNQDGSAGHVLSVALSVRVEDKYGNPIPAASVRFEPRDSGDRVQATQTFVDVVSDANGIAGGVSWTIGSSSAYALDATPKNGKQTTFHAR